MRIFKSNPLYLVFVVPIIVDVVGTVFGQPQSYWTSNYQIFREAVPVYPLLQISPVLFIAVCLALWLPFTYFLVQKLRKPLNLWAATSLLIGHGYNSVTWFREDLFQLGVFAEKDQLSQALSLIPMTLYILTIGYLAALGFSRYFERKKST